MNITIPYAISITKSAGIKQNYQSLRTDWDKRVLKNYILNACIYLLINRDSGMTSLEVNG